MSCEKKGLFRIFCMSRPFLTLRSITFTKFFLMGEKHQNSGVSGGALH